MLFSTTFQTYETIEERVNGEVVRRYLKGKLLGKGGFAKAYWATCLQTQKQYAMKVVLKSTLTKPKAKAKLQVRLHVTPFSDHRHHTSPPMPRVHAARFRLK